MGCSSGSGRRRTCGGRVAKRGLPLCCRDGHGERRKAAFAQVGAGLLNIPGLHAAVMQQRQQGALVRTRIGWVVHTMRIVRSVTDVISGPPSHNAQNAVLGHRRFLSMRVCCPAAVRSTRLHGYVASTVDKSTRKRLKNKIHCFFENNEENYLIEELVLG